MTRSTRALPSTLLPLVALAAALAAIGACGTNTPGSNPKVVSTVPADGALGVSPNTEVVVRFDRAMQAASLTVSTTGSTCGGTLQLSADDFASCLPFAASPTTSSGGATFHALPAQPLSLGVSYRLKVKAGVSSAQGRVLLQDFVMPDGFTVGAAPTPTPTPGTYSHTITIDGTNDFDATGERFDTTSPNYFGYVAWDASNLYLGMEGADVKSADANKFVVVYFGGTGGTTTGLTFNTQTPTLPFPAKYELQWGADNAAGSTLAFTWDGMNWVSAGWDFTGRVFANTTTGFVEFAIRRSDLGNPADIPLVMWMLNQTNMVEASYAGVPGDTFADMYDPPIAHYFDFDLGGTTTPAGTAEQ